MEKAEFLEAVECADDALMRSREWTDAPAGLEAAITAAEWAVERIRIVALREEALGVCMCAYCSHMRKTGDGV